MHACTHARSLCLPLPISLFPSPSLSSPSSPLSIPPQTHIEQTHAHARLGEAHLRLNIVQDLKHELAVVRLWNVFRRIPGAGSRFLVPPLSRQQRLRCTAGLCLHLLPAQPPPSSRSCQELTRPNSPNSLCSWQPVGPFVKSRIRRTPFPNMWFGCTGIVPSKPCFRRPPPFPAHVHGSHKNVWFQCKPMVSMHWPPQQPFNSLAPLGFPCNPLTTNAVQVTNATHETNAKHATKACDQLTARDHAKPPPNGRHKTTQSMEPMHRHETNAARET